MKKRSLAALAVLILVLSAGIVHAEEGAGVEIGIKGWWNEWKQERNGLGSITSDSTVLLGPEVSVKSPGGLYLEVSYLFSTSDYRFSDPSGTTDIDRQDFDLVIGYMFVPEIGIVTGYRDLWFNDHAGLKESVYGPILGIRFSTGENDPLSLYGKIDYQFTRFEEQDEAGTFREDSPGWIAEVGLRYAFTHEFSASIGYKYETNKGDTTEVRDTFTGMTFGAFLSL